MQHDIVYSTNILTYNMVLHTTPGQVGITLNSDWAEPKDIVEASDIATSDTALQTFLGWFAHPIYVNGDYPEVMKQQVANASAAEGRRTSRLPEFTLQQKNRIASQSFALFLLSLSLVLVLLLLFVVMMVLLMLLLHLCCILLLFCSFAFCFFR